MQVGFLLFDAKDIVGMTLSDVQVDSEIYLDTISLISTLDGKATDRNIQLGKNNFKHLCEETVHNSAFLSHLFPK